jgi:hypothetical protein
MRILLGTVYFYHLKETGAMAELITAAVTITACMMLSGKDDG